MCHGTLESTVKNLIHLNKLREKPYLRKGHGSYASNYDSNQRKSDSMSLERLAGVGMEFFFRSSTAISITQPAAHAARAG